MVFENISGNKEESAVSVDNHQISNGTSLINNGTATAAVKSSAVAEKIRHQIPPPPRPTIRVESPRVKYSADGKFMESEYEFQTTEVSSDPADDTVVIRPVQRHYMIRTKLQVPRVGLMMVGWGGNNGTTVTAGILANKLGLSWSTRIGQQTANYFGSLTQAATFRLGFDGQREVYAPMTSLVPTVNPNDLVLGGWDISGKNLYEAAERAHVLEPDLLRQLKGHMTKLKPLPSIYYPDFIAANQSKRADNLIGGDTATGTSSKQDHVTKIRNDISMFKAANKLDTVVVIWTATTERFSDILPGVNDTADNLLKSIDQSHPEIAPSTVFAVASILEGTPFINGSPQNTFVPGAVELAERRGVFIGGDDFKTGQTKLKSVLVDFLVSAGIKPLAITSYNHLGNNDGENLSAPPQFRSKEISKSNVVDDMVESNRLMYGLDEKPDHVIVIKYVPSVGDSKRALDEYYSEIFLGGRNTLAIHNTCEDSLLAAPLLIDLAVMTELLTRIEYKPVITGNDQQQIGYKPLDSVLSVLSYFLKAPLVPRGAPVVNALFRQRQTIENLLRAVVGLPPQSNSSVFETLDIVGAQRK